MRTSNGLLTIESGRLPIVDIAYHSVPPQTQIVGDYRESFDEYVRLAARGRPLVYLLDMRDFDPLQIDARTRQQAAQIFHTYVERLRPVSVAEARVITSPLTRGILTAFDWLTNANKWPCRQFGQVNDAEAWLRAQLEQRNLQAR